MTWQARFIAPDEELDSAPLLRREFALERGHGEVRSAELAITALGVVEPLLNGEPVSGDALTPGWSSYQWRIRVARYDVRHLLADANVLGLALGNGWYRGRLGWTGTERLYGDRIAGFAELLITFDDGATQRIVTDESWAAGPSAVLENDLYDGETIDARRQDDAWLRPGFADDRWGRVRVVDQSLDVLEEYLGPRVSRLIYF